MRYVYVLRTGEYYKVGMTKDVQARIAGLQTSNPKKIELVGSRLVRDAHALEVILHRYLTDHKAGGGTEWFKLSADLVIELMIKMNAYVSPRLHRDLDPIGETSGALDDDTELFFARLDRMLEVANSSAGVSNKKPRGVNWRYDNSELETMALEEFRTSGRVSTSHLQRHFSIGYAKAARIVDSLEEKGLISPSNGSNPTGRYLL